MNKAVEIMERYETAKKDFNKDPQAIKINAIYGMGFLLGAGLPVASAAMRELLVAKFGEVPGGL